jgi:hypothetical protein
MLTVLMQSFASTVCDILVPFMCVAFVSTPRYVSSLRPVMVARQFLLGGDWMSEYLVETCSSMLVMMCLFG